jgi:hypothetical protein
MQVLDDIWASIRGNAVTRINDPIVGAFVVSWGLCNWDRLALLLLGTGKLEVRINKFSQEMAFLNEPSLVLTNYDLLLLPLMLTIFYIFILPNIAHVIEKKLKPNQINRHDHTVDLDLNKVIKQKDLNKARLRANPENEFLAQEVKIDIEREKSEAEIKQAEAETAKNIQQETKAKETVAKIELEKREQQAETEKRTLAISTTKQKAELASHRFPSAYLFIELLSESLKGDDVVMSLSGLTHCIATTFGYESFSALLNDKKFTNENLELMKYVLLDTDSLTSEFSSILEGENIEECDSEWLIGHLEMIFDDLPYELIYQKTLAERIQEEIDIDSYELLNEDGVISGMHETNTIFDEVNEIIVDKYEYVNQDRAFIVNLCTTASGSHRKESDMAGQGIDISVEAICRSIIGKYGLLDYDIEAHATPMDYE